MRTVEHFTVACASQIKATIEFCGVTYTKAQQLRRHICSELRKRKKSTISITPPDEWDTHDLCLS